MVLIAGSSGACTHSGTICGGNVAGTLTSGSNSFVFVESDLVMVEDATMEVPLHNNPPCIPTNIKSHSYTPDTLINTFVFVESLLMNVEGDEYASDKTIITDASQTFVSIV